MHGTKQIGAKHLRENFEGRIFIRRCRSIWEDSDICIVRIQIGV
jgi:hypothetical protein